MNVYLALLLFSIIILLYWVIAEMFTFFFRFTGLPAERARFQVVSMLTGTGFTTRESEVIMASRRRRRLARVTMLFGYVFNVTVLTAFINVFLSMKLAEVGHQFLSLLIPLATAAVIFIFMRVPKVHTWGVNFLQQLLRRFFDKRETFNAVMLIDTISTESIARVTLRQIPEEYRGRTLAETRLRAETGIRVMLVERHGGKTAMPAQADTVFEPGDAITVFGDYQTICKTFHAKQHYADD